MIGSPNGSYHTQSVGCKHAGRRLRIRPSAPTVLQVTVEDATVMEPVDGVKTVQAERWNLLCCVCKQRMGAKIQCQACYTAYHPLCGRIAGGSTSWVGP